MPSPVQPKRWGPDDESQRVLVEGDRPASRLRASRPPGLLPTAGEPGVEPIESALRLADRVTRIHGWPTLIYSLAVPAEDLEKLAAALGISHREGPRLHPETLEGLETLLNGLVEWVRERGLQLLIVDASHADPDELEVLVPLLRYFSTEWPIYTV